MNKELKTAQQQTPSPFGEQDESGIDLSLLKENLRLTPTERFEKHARALELVWEVKRAAQEAGIWRDLSSS